MSTLLNYEEFLNEKKEIKFVYTTGNTNTSMKKDRLTKSEIIYMLSNPDEITDDEIFTMTDKTKLTISDLEGHIVTFDGKEYQL